MSISDRGVVVRGRAFDSLLRRVLPWGLCLLAGCGPQGLREDEGALFVDVAEQVGVDFLHEVLVDGHRIPEVLGSGCAVFDADGDGRLDLYFVSAGNGPADGTANRLYLRTAEGGYRDATGESGLGDRGFGLGVAVGDVDNDGDFDVYVTNWGQDVLYRNDGGTFVARRAAAGLVGDALSTSAAFLDYDGDGCLDLFVVHYVDPSVLANGAAPQALPEYLPPRAYPSVSDTLYRNRGDGTFEDVSTTAGISATEAAPGLGVRAEDFDGDGWTDVLVANDGTRNHLWINQRDGTFREDGIAAGIALNGRGVSEAGMGIAVGDVDRDGHRDVLMTHLQGETDTLYRGGNRGFDDVSARAGVAGPSLAFTAWGAAFIDAENDGDLDLFTAHGSIWRLKERRSGPAGLPWDAYAEPDRLLLNDGTGTFHDDVTSDPGHRSVAWCSRGVAVGDLDGDGDLDVVVTTVGGPARILENRTPHVGHWLAVRVVDPSLGRDVPGSRIEVAVGGTVMVAYSGTDAGYLSSSAPDVHFGLGAATVIESLTVVWPGGRRERFVVPAVDRTVVCVAGSGTR